LCLPLIGSRGKKRRTNGKRQQTATQTVRHQARDKRLENEREQSRRRGRKGKKKMRKGERRSTGDTKPKKETDWGGPAAGKDAENGRNSTFFGEEASWG